MGFVKSLRIAASEEVEPGPLYREAIVHPVCKFLRSLTWGCAVFEDENEYSEVTAAMRETKAPETLDTLYITDTSSDESELSWCAMDDIATCWKSFPNLRDLHVRAGEFELGDLSKLPKLESLRITTGGIGKGNVKSIAAAKLPKLTRLEIYFGQEGRGGMNKMKEVAKEMATILEGKNWPKLTTLGIMNCEFIDELAKTLGKARILKQLERLDLSKGTLTDDGAKLLADQADAFAHLKEFDVTENYLTEAGEKLIKKAIKKADTDDQREGYTSSDGTVHRYAAVGE
jgi:hypothetical protein